MNLIYNRVRSLILRDPFPSYRNMSIDDDSDRI